MYYRALLTLLMLTSIRTLKSMETGPETFSEMMAPEASLSSLASSLFNTIANQYNATKNKLGSMLQNYQDSQLSKAAQAPDDNPELIKKLVYAGANVHTVDTQGMTPLHHAVLKGNYKIAQELVAARAKIDLPVAAEAKKYAGMTPLMLALSKAPTNASRRFKRESPYTQLVFFLLTAGAALDTQDAGGRTALFWAKDKPNLLIALQDAQETREKNKQAATAMRFIPQATSVQNMPDIRQ